MPSCKSCNAEFEITADETALHARVAQAAGVPAFPAPRDCPPCREQRRMSWRNERNIFARSCSQSGKKLFSAYSPSAEMPVLENALWWKAENDPLSYGRDVDFSRGIFPQMAELRRVVPRLSNFNYAEERQVNSAYTNCAGDLKDCYLIFASARNERCMYCNYVNDSYGCVDCFFCFHSTNCYESLDLQKCHAVHYSSDCRECRDSLFLFDCRNCSNCIGCIGLRNKQYHLFNEPYSREDYERECAKLGFAPGAALTARVKEALEARFAAILKTSPRRARHGENNENSRGDYISNTKDCFQCFDTVESRDCMYCAWFQNGRDCADFYAWGEAELCYSISGGGDDHYGCAFSAMSFGCKQSLYLDLCAYAKNCFASVSLRSAQYCILNKQYSKDEYETLVPKVIELMKRHGEWGEFFPGADSPYGYNYSVAADYYPLDAAAVKKAGYRWDDYRAPEVSAAAGDPSVVRCAESGRPFRLVPQELHFYSQNGLPEPTIHPELRYARRLRSRNPRRLWKRFCEKCGESVETSYPSENPVLVYCERCYLEAVY